MGHIAGIVPASMKRIDPIMLVGLIFLLLLIAADIAITLGFDDWLPEQSEERQ